MKICRVLKAPGYVSSIYVIFPASDRDYAGGEDDVYDYAPGEALVFLYADLLEPWPFRAHGRCRRRRYPSKELHAESANPGRPRGTVGKASASEARGTGFEPPWLVQRSRWPIRWLETARGLEPIRLIGRAQCFPGGLAASSLKQGCPYRILSLSHR